MSYHVTIVRTKGHSRIAITLDEVKAVISSFPDLAAVRAREGDLELSRISLGPASPLLIYEDGEIWTGTPDRDTLQLMLDLAARLNARVRGDEMETYRTPEDTYHHPDDLEKIQEADVLTKRMLRTRRLKGWSLYGAILLVFILLGLWANHFSR